MGQLEITKTGTETGTGMGTGTENRKRLSNCYSSLVQVNKIISICCCQCWSTILTVNHMAINNIQSDYGSRDCPRGKRESLREIQETEWRVRETDTVSECMYMYPIKLCVSLTLSSLSLSLSFSLSLSLSVSLSLSHTHTHTHTPRVLLHTHSVPVCA